MNARVKALYDEYLKMTGKNGAAASLTLADVMQSTLDAKTTPAVTPASVLTVMALLAMPPATGPRRFKVADRPSVDGT